MAATVMHSTSVEAEAEVLLVRCGVLQVMPVLWEAVTFEADQWEEMGITWSPRDLKERYLQLLGDHLRNSREDAD